MVAGKVKTAIGLQKQPNPPKPPSKSPLLPPATTSAKKQDPPRGSRPFGAYFPRASAQVQPRPPDVAELLHLVEELRERESRLKTELLEQKLVRQSAAIVPVLENEISARDVEIERGRRKIECLETENERLRNENEFLHLELSKQNCKYDEKIRFMQAELADIKESFVRRERDDEYEVGVEVEDEEAVSVSALSSSYSSASPSSSTNTTPKSVVSSSKASSSVFTESCLRKCLTENKIEFTKNEAKSEEFPETSYDSLSTGMRSAGSRVPKPPPLPSASFLSSISPLAGKPCIPPPPPPSKSVAPPPPPPPPVKGSKMVPAKVRRVPEVVEFYHSLMRRDSNGRRDGAAADNQAAGATAKDMIGEIENRSTHLLAIKTDVETHGDLIRFLIQEVGGAAFTDIEDVVPFVKWLDEELSYLVDERAVLKHFDWPEKKADALREAAFGYCDLKKLECEASSFRDDRKQAFGPALKKMQSLFEKLEHGVYNLSRLRESAMKKYRGFQIPTNWMLDTGYVSQIKLASVKLAVKYMKRVLAELELVGGGPEEEELIVQGVKFAFRVHQFAGGFDVESMKVFQELKDKSQMCNVQYQSQHPHKLVCRSSATC